MTRLSQLAADPKSARRGDIFLAIASLYQSQGARLSERERSLMREILQRLAGDVEMAIRISLAERLADDDEAPIELILMLADDRIEVARPVILRSRRLTDEDLLSLLNHAGEDHQIACAQRPHIGEPVSEVLTARGSEPVLVTLVRNATARIAPQTFASLVEKSREIEGLQGALAHRTDLPQPLAQQLCEWVSDSLRAHIRAAFPAVAAVAEPQLAAAAAAIQQPQAAAGGAGKLVDKLLAAGQLKAGFLLRVLHQGQMDLFETAFSRLLGLEPERTAYVLYQAGAAPLALACRAVGIDRCVYATVFNLSRQAKGLRASLSASEQAEVENVFQGFTKFEALSRIRSLATGTEAGL